ncbi:MAG: hypothetical protein DRG09_02175 [Epsilonproteobacteria bacterium]|nr:MAG: hypothetical protein DRG09_02175 [Campylobacterota bacterium]
MRSPQKFLLATGLGLLLSTSTLSADTMSPKDIAKKVYDALDNHQSYAFNATIVNHSDEGENTHNVSVKINRPNQLRVDIIGDIRNRTNYLNNGLYTIYDHDKNFYLHIDTPKSIEDTLDAIFDTFEIKSPLAQLIYTNMGERIKFDNSKNFGIVDLNGVECHYIAFSDKTKDVHVWVTTGETPLVKHYRIVDKTSKNNAYRSTTIYWKNAKTISPSDFTFAAPKNAKEVFID